MGENVSAQYSEMCNCVCGPLSALWILMQRVTYDFHNDNIDECLNAAGNKRALYAGIWWSDRWWKVDRGTEMLGKTYTRQQLQQQQ